MYADDERHHHTGESKTDNDPTEEQIPLAAALQQ